MARALTVTKTFVFKRGQYCDRSRLRCEERRHRAAQARVVCADPAALGTSVALLLRCRDLFLQRTGGLRRHEVQGSERRERHATASSRQTITNGWLASLQHQFVAAVVPPAGQPYSYQAAGSRQRISAERHRPDDRSGRGRQGAVPRRTVRRPETAIAAGGDRHRIWSAPSTSAF